MEHMDFNRGFLTARGWGEEQVKEYRLHVTRDHGFTMQSLMEIDFMGNYCRSVCVEGKDWVPPVLTKDGLDGYNRACLKSLLDLFKEDYTEAQKKMDGPESLMYVPRDLARGHEVYCDLYWRYLGFENTQSRRRA